MKLRLALACAISVAALQPATAAAPAPETVRVVLAAYGTCIVKREGELARKLVLSGEFLDRRYPNGDRLVQGECLQKNAMRLRMDNAALKGAMAQALFDRDTASLTLTTFDGTPTLTYAEPWPVKATDRNGEDLRPEQVERRQKAFDLKRGEVLRARLGECVVRASGAAARAVLVTPINTPAELEALKAIAPALSGCLPKGETIGFDRMTLRGALATGYYRLATAAQPTGAAQ